MASYSKALAPTRAAVERRSLSPFPEMMELHRLLSGLPLGGVEQSVGTWQPPVDIFEGSDSILIKMDLPEIHKEDVQVHLDGQTLTIQGERRLENEDQRDRYHRVERAYGQFARSFTVPPNVNREGLRAEYTDGVLRIALPKLEEAKPRQITVE